MKSFSIKTAPGPEFIQKGHKHCIGCGQDKPEREFTGNYCYACVKIKRDIKYSKYKETHFL